MVTSEGHIRELSNAPMQQLSLHAVAKEVLLPCTYFCIPIITLTDTPAKVHNVWL